MIHIQFIIFGIGSGKIQRSFEGGTKHEQYKTGDLPHEWEGMLQKNTINMQYTLTKWDIQRNLVKAVAFIAIIPI